MHSKEKKKKRKKERKKMLGWVGGGVLLSVFIQHIDRRLPQERRDRFNHAGQLGLLASKYSLAVRGWSEDWTGGGGGGEGGRGAGGGKRQEAGSGRGR